MAVSRATLVAIVVTSTLLVVAGVVAGVAISSQREGSGPITLSASVLDEDRAIRRSHFDRIQTGMSLEEVVGIVGREGEERSRTEITGRTSAVYGWTNPGGSNMLVVLSNGRVVSKAQSGLR